MPAEAATADTPERSAPTPPQAESDPRDDESGCGHRVCTATAAASRVRAMFFEIFRQMSKQLAQLDVWLDKADASAKSRSFDANAFLQCRLAPDQFVFVQQIQITCDTAKAAASRLSGKEAPVHADTEQTVDELRARVRGVIEYLDGMTAEDFAEAATVSITQPRWQGKTMTGRDYFVEHAVPNFYFHLAHSYALLRANGVPVGKRDYLGALTQKAAPAGGGA